MTKKRLNKLNVTYKFRTEILAQDDNDKLGADGKLMLWQLFLYQLSLAGFISKNSAKTWIYPIKQLK